MTITSLALELPRKSVKHSSWKKLTVTVSSYRSATSYKNVLNSRDRVWLFGRPVISWRVQRDPFNYLLTVQSAHPSTIYWPSKALTLQLFTDRPNNPSRSLGSLELIKSNWVYWSSIQLSLASHRNVTCLSLRFGISAKIINWS